MHKFYSLGMFVKLVLLSLTVARSGAAPTQNDAIESLCYATPDSLIKNDFTCSCGRESLHSIPKQSDISNEPIIALRIYNCSGIKGIGEEDGSAFPELEILDIQGCGIVGLDVKSGILNANHHIEKLILKDNKLSTIELGASAGMPNLLDLDLSGNNLEIFSGEALKNVTTLKTLILDDNQLVKIDLGDIPSLEKLSIKGNKISSIEPYAFRNMTSIQEIYLDNNLLKTLDMRPFYGLENLTVISMSNNKIKRIIAQIDTEKMAKLNVKILELACNDLTVFTSELFTSMPDLERFNASNNSLYHIEKDAFSKLRKLKVLDLSHNKLTHPEIGWTTALVDNDDGLESDLSHNPWICDYHTDNYKEYMSEIKKNGTKLDVQCTADDKRLPSSQQEKAESNDTPDGIDLTLKVHFEDISKSINSLNIHQVKSLLDKLGLVGIPIQHENETNRALQRNSDKIDKLHGIVTVFIVLLIFVLIFAFGLGVYVWKFRSQIIYRVSQIIAENIEKISIHPRSLSPSGSTRARETPSVNLSEASSLLHPNNEP